MVNFKEYTTKRAAFLKQLRDENGTEGRPFKKTAMNRTSFTKSRIMKKNRAAITRAARGYYNSFWQDNVRLGRIVLDDAGIPRVTKLGTKYIKNNKK
jgi:hypothetical protein